MLCESNLYEFQKERKSNITYFKVFGYHYFILNNNKDKLSKFDIKSDEEIFLSYSSINRAYRIFNKRILVVEESIHVIFDEIDNFPSKEVDLRYDIENLDQYIYEGC